MTALITMLLLLAQAQVPTLEQIRADGNPEHRAKLAVEFAVASERSAEAAYSKGDMKEVSADLKLMLEGAELANQSLEQTGKSARRHAGPFKSAELKSQEILKRLADLETRMDSEDRAAVAGPRARVQEIHDGWFEGIMGGKK